MAFKLSTRIRSGSVSQKVSATDVLCAFMFFIIFPVLFVFFFFFIYSARFIFVFKKNIVVDGLMNRRVVRMKYTRGGLVSQTSHSPLVMCRNEPGRTL